jgi:hypothetical protein
LKKGFFFCKGMLYAVSTRSIFRVYAEQTDPTIVTLIDKCLFHPSVNGRTVNNRQKMSCKVYVLTLEGPLYGIEFGVWCAMSATEIILSRY